MSRLAGEKSSLAAADNEGRNEACSSSSSSSSMPAAAAGHSRVRTTATCVCGKRVLSVHLFAVFLTITKSRLRSAKFVVV